MMETIYQNSSGRAALSRHRPPPGIAAILPHSWGDAINPYLPSSAGAQVMALHPDPSGLAPWTGFALFLGYAVVTLAVAAVLLVRRDT